MKRIYTKEPEHLFYTDRTNEWKEGCFNLSIYGSIHSPRRNLFDENDDSSDCHDNDESNSTPVISQVPQHNILPTISLIGSSAAEIMDQISSQTSSSHHCDTWLTKALLLYESMNQMTQELQSHELAYCHYNILSSPSEILTDSNASSLEATVASFLTSTVSQLESLRQSLQPMATSLQYSLHVLQHYEGIVSHLATVLESLTIFFSKMKKERSRETLERWRDPLKVTYEIPGSLEEDNIKGSSGGSSLVAYQMPILDPEYEEYLNRVREEDELQFLAIYPEDDDIIEQELLNDLNAPLPTFGQPHGAEQCRTQAALDQEVEIKPMPIGVSKNSMISPLPSTTIKQDQYQQSMSYTNDQVEKVEALQQESALLTATIQNSQLDDVHKVESQMMQITSLLTQFTSLLSDQQEEIVTIHENTIKSKENVEQGKEQLIKATETRKRGTHYFAWLIVIMGILLLFLNWIFP
jgi:hypothetical protein